MAPLPEKEKINWHTADIDQSKEMLVVDPSIGLASKEVNSRLQEYGRNELSIEKGPSTFIRFLKQFHNILIYLLIAAGVVTALLGHWIDTFVILGVVLVNAIIGFIQEGKAEQALAQLQKMLSPKAQVLRDGKKVEIAAENLVPGDVVFLKSGDRVPADLRFIQVRNLRIDEAILTGESQPVEKSLETVEESSALGDRTNLAYSGTLVTFGRGKGLVVETGQRTELGKIREMISGVKKLTTPLLRKMDEFAKWLSVFILGMAGFLLLLGWLFGKGDITELFLSVIALAVAAIPEGLPAIMTITLALGVRKMAGRNAIIRKLPAVETLGSVSVICTDKTGTLTRNEMMVTTIQTKEAALKVDGQGYQPEGTFKTLENDELIDPLKIPTVKSLLECAFYCNDALVEENENGEWELNGDPTEGALYTVGVKAKMDRDLGNRLDSIPFESENKYMATLHQFDEGNPVILVKGAAEKILSFSKVEKEELDSWKERINQMASNGLRVLGFAQKKTDKNQLSTKEVENDLEFLGLVGIIDPPREEAIKSIEDCKQAGIEIKMITGDHGITASAIGKKIGITNSDRVITGEELSVFTADEEWENAAENYFIFARTNPEHKLKLVEALQRMGKIVAMTGDGVNDAPALKRADVGVAMGIKGTEVTKNAAEMVLADDNFQSIASAVEEGRTIYNNLRKAILFILPTNGAEALLVMSSILIGFTLPITPVQVLWVNMVTAVTLALALAFEPPEKNIMKVPPRNPGDSVLGGYFIWRIVFVSVLVAGFSSLLFFYFLNSHSVEFARTIALNTLVAGQVFYLFNSRYLVRSCLSFEGIFGNNKVILAGGVLLLLQLCHTYLPFMQTWFETQPLKISDWGLLSLAGLMVFLLVEAEKLIYRKFFNFGR
nr:cation-transporting P-type ATPase [Saprospiraceae bacterium]